MGQKVNPNGIRLGINKDWKSTWYTDGKNFAKYLNADIKIRRFLKSKLKDAAVSFIKIERPARTAKVTIHSARPGVIIGRRGGGIDALRDEVSRMMQCPVHLAVEEIRKPELDAQLVAENIAQQLERRVMFRRAMKRSVQNTMRAGAKGVKITLGGRLSGAEIARSESIREGRVPLHTFRADIDYATARAHTTYGIIGVKVWIFKGEVVASKGEDHSAAEKVED